MSTMKTAIRRRRQAKLDRRFASKIARKRRYSATVAPQGRGAKIGAQK